MSGKLETLKKSVIFSALAPEELKRLGTIMENEATQEGETLATKGEKAANFFILASGTLLIAMDEGKALVLDRPGDFIGMELISSKDNYTSTIIVLEPGEIFTIKQEDFIGLIQEDSAMAETILQYWNTFLEETAPFVEQKETPGFEYHY